MDAIFNPWIPQVLSEIQNCHMPAEGIEDVVPFAEQWSASLSGSMLSSLGSDFSALPMLTKLIPLQLPI